MGDYAGRDGWHVGRPVREISDEYVRGQFVRHARGLLGDLDRMHLNVTNVPLQDDDRAKVYEGHRKPQVDETNPSWYSELYWSPDNTFDRVGRHHRRRGKNGVKLGEIGNPTRPNMARKQAESTDSKIVRWRVKKALEEIVDQTDIPLAIGSRRARRIKIVDGKRERVWEKTPYYHGSNHTLMRTLITERLIHGYSPEESEGRPDWEAPGDDKVRAYFGMISYAEEQIRGRWEGETQEDPQEPVNDEQNSDHSAQREPGEDLDERGERENSNPTPKEFDDDIPF